MPAVAGDDLVCAGGDTMQPLAQSWANAFHARRPSVRVQIRDDAKLAADGFALLLDEKIDCALFVRELFPAESAAFERKYGYAPLVIPVAGGSYATKGGTHAIAIYVNAGNPLNRISLAQLASVFAGARYWGELGVEGAFATHPIHLYGMLHRRETGNPPGIVNFLQQRVLHGAAFRDDAREQVDRPGEGALEAIPRRVAEDPDGIGYSGFGFAVAGAKSVAIGDSDAGPFYRGTPEEVTRGVYPLRRHIYLIVHRRPGAPLSPPLQSFLRFVLSAKGQSLLADDRTRFLPLPPAEAASARALLE
ncbi:PstS family phosphate ABC transporter substrate-binding protein [Roseiterribacter gracilis]|uniref:Phosphate-binding protein PstS n=1 Tax=Roseiterribacter gracilis TaxID=2812848 RepID=A0A8S8XGT5_9PROT|nr:phosphate-binding protein PstS [Rhodospirillales bacterium TMPK1]